MNNQFFYHFHKIGNHDKKWFVGNELSVDKNEFSKFSHGFSSKINAYGQSNVPILNVIDYSIKINDTKTQLELLKISAEVIYEFSILIREITYEDIRSKNHSNLPSRNNCIWLCREDQLDYWKKNIDGNIELYKIEIFNDVFRTRNSLISLPADSYNEIVFKAGLYWGYNSEILNEDDEYLYNGKFKIIEKINL